MSIEQLQIFDLTLEVKQKLRLRLEQKPEIFSLESDPLLASLISCAGLAFEIGRPGWDRLSSWLGVSVEDQKENPWQFEIVIYNDQINDGQFTKGQIGIRLWLKSLETLKPRHLDFASILHPLSFNDKGELRQLVIFPLQVAQNYKHKGLELVIVRDWVLNSALATDAETLVAYQLANEAEIRQNSARFQARLMPRRQVAFSGTHDLADHLLGGTGNGFLSARTIFGEIDFLYEQIFSNRSDPALLKISYLIGVLLDDLAQPVWYASEMHHLLLEKAKFILHGLAQKNANQLCTQTDLSMQLPHSFHTLIHQLREMAASKQSFDLLATFNKFVLDIQIESNETQISTNVS